jgi:ureidoglycolate lyase/seryl-tRNA synthetase
LYGQNNAVQHNSDYEVDGKYILGHALPPESEPVIEYNRPENIYIWHVNYHPDGGQLFFPTTKSSFISPLALPGDDVQVGDFKAFYFDGSQGLYIHPNVWHEGVFPIQEKSSFKGRQGKVHARVSIDLQKEFKKYIYFKTAF